MRPVHVEVLQEPDRPALVQMLEDAGDVESATIGMYRVRRAMPDVMLVAWVNDTVVGMLNASYVADLRGSSSFDPFDLPRPPHAFMDRIHVHPSMRRGGVGQALVTALIRVATDSGCSFAGGHVDATSDSTGRIAFFEQLGFDVYGNAPEFTAGMRL